jgi:hypothetical protein
MRSEEKWCIGQEKHDISLSLMCVLAMSVSDITATRYNVPHATPRRYQGARGTCWDFGTMAPLSHAYRLQGIKKGYLDADEYVRGWGRDRDRGRLLG